MHIEPHKAVFMIVGHKSDMNEARAVTTHEGKTFAEFHGLRFLETSAKNGTNVEDVFVTIAKDIYTMLEQGQFKLQEGWDGIKNGFSRPRETFMLEEPEEDKTGCCGGGGAGSS